MKEIVLLNFRHFISSHMDSALITQIFSQTDKENSAYIFCVFSSYAKILITSQFPDVKCLTLICSLLAWREMENINFHLTCYIFLCLEGLSAHVITDYSFLNFNAQHNIFKSPTSHFDRPELQVSFPSHI